MKRLLNLFKKKKFNEKKFLKELEKAMRTPSPRRDKSIREKLNNICIKHHGGLPYELSK